MWLNAQDHFTIRKAVIALTGGTQLIKCSFQLFLINNGYNGVDPSAEQFLTVTIIEMTLLLLTLLGGASVVLSTLQVGISPMPSSSKARKAILNCCKNTGTGPIYELGCGWGNLLIALAKRYPNRQIVGYELSLLPWFTCLCLIKLFRLHNVQLYRKNFLKADLSQAKTICCYLYPEGMQKLAEKLSSSEAQPDYLISNTFALPSQQPQKTIRLEDLYRSPVYLYQLSHDLK